MDKLLVGQILAIKIHVCKPKAKMVSGGLQEWAVEGDWLEGEMCSVK